MESFKFGITSENEELTIAFAKTVLKKKQWKYAEWFNPLTKRCGTSLDLFFSSNTGSTWSDCPEEKEEETYFFSRTCASEQFRMFNLPEDWDAALDYVDFAYEESLKVEITMEQAIEIIADAMNVSCRRVVIKPTAEK